MLFQNLCVVSSLMFFQTAIWKECRYQMQWFYTPYRMKKHKSILGLALFFLPALFLHSAMSGSFSLLISSLSVGLLFLFFASPLFVPHLYRNSCDSRTPLALNHIQLVQVFPELLCKQN